MDQFDVVVIGAGIVGLATAHALLGAEPTLRIAIIDKEGSIAGHQTGRNSGVIHAGVYYKPGSEKARLCTAGRQRMVEFCAEHEVAYEICGKVVVAVAEDERPRLAELHRRCVANGVDVEMIGAERLRELEPHAAGIEALHVKVTGIADYPGVLRGTCRCAHGAGRRAAPRRRCRRGRHRLGRLGDRDHRRADPRRARRQLRRSSCGSHRPPVRRGRGREGNPDRPVPR